MRSERLMCREGEASVPLGSTSLPYPSARSPRGRAEAGILSGGQVSYARSPLPCLHSTPGLHLPLSHHHCQML